ncbi:MAG: glycosyltransferase family 2 protein [Spongiibacteraceae bacterium]
MHTINICILTFQRERLLETCLASLAVLKNPDNCKLIITVIDNDAAEASRHVVETFRDQSAIEVIYLCEPSRGIPVARNAAIVKSQELNADYIAFIDDDEWVQSDWLVQLYSYCQKMGGDIVVSGNVISEFPKDTPSHIKSSLQRKHRATGKELNSCATNNVLFPISLTTEMGLRFDVSNPLAGGTDTIFFAQAKSRGVSIYKCSEAIVFELVPASRANIKWISKRKFRAGITESWRKQHNGESKVNIFVASLFHITKNFLKAVVMILVNNKSQRNRAWFKCSKSAGVLYGLFGGQVSSYSVIDS